jgi:hypothetical protein
VIKNKWQEWKEKNKAMPWDILNPKIGSVNENIYKERILICSSCEHLTKSTFQCKKCGCFMKLKAKLPHASCPINKWKELDE